MTLGEIIDRLKAVKDKDEEFSAEAIALWIMGVIADSDPYPDVIKFRPLDKEAFLLKTKYGEEFVISVEKKNLEES